MHIYRARGRLLRDLCSLHKNDAIINISKTYKENIAY